MNTEDGYYCDACVKARRRERMWTGNLVLGSMAEEICGWRDRISFNSADWLDDLLFFKLIYSSMIW